MNRKSKISIGLLSVFALLSGVYMANPAGTNSKDPRARLLGHMPYRIPSNSMTPSLQQGDFILANTFSYHSSEPERGDIIVFNFPSKPKMVFVKRVIGVPGDMVELHDHALTLNGQAQYEAYLQTHREFSRGEKPYKQLVPQGHLLVLGDNRDRSADSRVQGLVPIDHVIGEVTRIWMSNQDSRVGTLDRAEQPQAISLKTALR